MKRKITIKGFLQSADLHADLKQHVSGTDFVDISLKLTDKPVSDLREKAIITDLLLIEIDASDPQQLIDFEEEAQNNLHSTTLVLLNNSNANTVRNLMRLGVHDVLPMPDSKDELLNELHELVSNKQQHLQSSSSKVITFLNAKGGSGATTLAINTAHVLATKYEAKVCLLDLDIQFGKVALFLDIAPEKTILSALNQPDRIDPVFIKALITHHESGLDILASPGSLDDTSNVSAASIAQTIDALSETYDYIIVDMPHTISQWSVEALRKSDRNFLVTQSCLSVIRDAKLLLDKLSEYSVDTNDFEIINNRASKKTGMIDLEQMLQTLKRKAAFSIRNNYPAVIESQETGKPLTKIGIAGNINHDIDLLADAICKDKQAHEIKTGFFARMFH